MYKLILPLALIILGCNSTSVLQELEADKSFAPGIPVLIDIDAELRSQDGLFINSEKGDDLALQLYNDHQACFVPKNQILKGEHLFIKKSRDSITETNTIRILEKNGAIAANWQGQEILRYAVNTQMPPDTAPLYYQRSGFIHPLKTKSGQVVTAGFPNGHTHQHGLFNAWTRTHFRGHLVDFWNQQSQLGTVRHKKVNKIINGPLFSSFSVDLEQVAYVNGDTVVALDETWLMHIIPMGNTYLIDWTIQQKCHAEDSLILDEYHYGGAAFRGSEMWNIEKGAYDSLVYFLTNEGKSQIDGNHSRPLWAAMYGNTGGGSAGVALMGHSTNFRYPQPIRVHPSMPYFCYIPSVLGTFSIAPGETYQSRYRIHVYDGEPVRSKLNQLQVAFQN